MQVWCYKCSWLCGPHAVLELLHEWHSSICQACLTVCCQPDSRYSHQRLQAWSLKYIMNLLWLLVCYRRCIAGGTTITIIVLYTSDPQCVQNLFCVSSWQVPIAVKGRIVNWIDSKATFGDTKSHLWALLNAERLFLWRLPFVLFWCCIMLSLLSGLNSACKLPR